MTRAVVAKRRRRLEHQRQHPAVYMAPAGTTPFAESTAWRRIGRLAGWSGRAG